MPRIRAPVKSAISSSLEFATVSPGNTMRCPVLFRLCPGAYCGLVATQDWFPFIHSRRIGCLLDRSRPVQAYSAVAASCGIGNGRLACWPSENPSGRSAHPSSLVRSRGPSEAALQKRVLIPARSLGAQLRMNRLQCRSAVRMRISLFAARFHRVSMPPRARAGPASRMNKAGAQCFYFLFMK